jgi:threonine dehydrogenase-like Zn-dependent dehydrogenase
MGLRMIGIDHGSKEKLSKDCGAEAFFDVTKYSGEDGDKKLAEDVKAATTGGLGAASVVVCTASNKAYGQALSFLKFRGSVVCVGVPGELTSICASNTNADSEQYVIQIRKSSSTPSPTFPGSQQLLAPESTLMRCTGRRTSSHWRR